MKNLMVLAVSASLALAACSSPTAVQPGSSQASTGIIKGQVVIPYRLQTSARVSQNFNLMNYFAGDAAIAEEEAPAAAAPAEAAPAPAAEAPAAAAPAAEAPAAAADAPPAEGAITPSEAQTLEVSVDGEAATATVTAVAPSADGTETVVSFEASSDDLGQGTEVVEVTTTDGELVGSVAVDAAPGGTTTVTVTPETTATVEAAIEKHGARKIADLTAEELAKIAADPATLNKAAAVRSLFKKDGTLKANKDRNFTRKGAAAKGASADHMSDKGAEKSEGKGKPETTGKPADAGKPETTGKPADKGGKPADKGKPADSTDAE